MSEFAKELSTVTIEDELKKSYLDYAMSVIVGRALPDLRDGLKPVHRRVLFAMNELNNDWNKPHKKSARIVGDVIGKYHPHGDTAVYDTIVRMAQPFSLREMLVDGQGNFGSVDGDSPAAMRYTEIRMSKLAHLMLADIEKETVGFVPNYDGTELIPEVLPTRFPNLLVNGSSGIAVGMATNIPSHNIGEVINATLALIDNVEMTIQQLMEIIPGPDFPTAGIINGRTGIAEAYLTGRGRIRIRAKAHIETDQSNKASIIVTELPYQVNKAKLLEKIGELVKLKKLEGITALRDESDKSGMRMVVEVRRSEQPDIVLNNLYAHTPMESVFGINMVALDHGQPRTLNLKQMLEAFIQHRREVVTKRSVFELKKARSRTHILEGLAIAIANIDSIIAAIKAAKNPADAKEVLLTQVWQSGQVSELLARTDSSVTRPLDLHKNYGLFDDGYHLSPDQAQAILELRLHRLTGLEQEKIYSEYLELIDAINQLIKILSEPTELHRVIREELLEVKEEYNNPRRTEIIGQLDEITNEDLIPVEKVVVTLSKDGYVKTQSLDQYSAQHRGGRGKAATKVKDEDFVTNILIASTHDLIMCFSTRGKVYWLKVYEIPSGARQSKGRPLINLLPIEKDEIISEILPVSILQGEQYIFMATQQGIVKKVVASQFAKPRYSGLIALDLNPGDELISALLTNGQQEVMLFTSAGKAIRYHENKVRPTGRTARGVRGIKLGHGQRLIAAMLVTEGADILTATENGYGQRTRFVEYRPSGRGGQGVQVIKVNNRNGELIAAEVVNPTDEVLLITDQGTMIRTPVAEVSLISRNTQGVRLISLNEGERLVAVEPVQEIEDFEVLADSASVTAAMSVADIAEDPAVSDEQMLESDTVSQESDTASQSRKMTVDDADL